MTDTLRHVDLTLLTKGGILLQILEGDPKEVQKIYGKIAMDLRHEG